MSDDALARALACLSPYEREFYRIEVEGRSPAVYAERLRRIGFQSRGRVLDLACGVGQWTLALAELNDYAVGVDIAPHRLLLAEVLAASRNVSNVEYRWADMETLPYGAGEFDAAFCYGAFMFADGERVLRQLREILKAGAPLYVNANGAGWYLHRLRTRFSLDMAVHFARMTVNRLFGRYRRSIYSRRRLAHLLEKHGFVIDSVASEGRIGGDGVVSFYPGRYLGMDAVFEVLAHKA